MKLKIQSRQRGFALVSTLLLMVLLSILAVGMISLPCVDPFHACPGMPPPFRLKKANKVSFMPCKSNIFSCQRPESAWESWRMLL